MNGQDRQAIEGVFSRLGELERQGVTRDPEADTFIQSRMQQQPGAAYFLAQTVVVQEQALQAAQARISELEQRQPASASANSAAGLNGTSTSGSHGTAGGVGLGSSGGADADNYSFGRQPSRGDVGSAPRPGPAPAPSLAQKLGFGAGPGGAQANAAPGANQARPAAGGGFLAGAMQTAMGVAGGMMLGNMLGGMFGSKDAQAAPAPEGAQDAAGNDVSGEHAHADASAQDVGYDDGGGFDDMGGFDGGFDDI